MRFLCLHGMGTSSQIFESQTAALRHALGDEHVFEFVEGSVPFPPAPGIKEIYPEEEEYYAYFIPGDDISFRVALDDLRKYLKSEAPFDAVLAFSQGASIAATLMAQHDQRDPASTSLPFSFAVFMSGGPPWDTRDVWRPYNAKEDGEIIQAPTLNILSTKDHDYYHASLELMALCRSQDRQMVNHQEGHEVPRKSVLTREIARRIQVMIDKVMLAQ